MKQYLTTHSMANCGLKPGLLVVLVFSLLTNSIPVLAQEPATTGQAHPWFGPQRLYEKYKDLQPQLKTNVFGEPFYLKADVQNELTMGDAYAHLPYDYKLVADTLTAPQHLCIAVLLHINVKGCVVEHRDRPKPIVVMYVGRKEYQKPENAFKVSYVYTVSNHSDKYTLISLIADKGPLHTQNIALYVECLPVDTHSTFLHFTYSANYGGFARFALNSYLATVGRNKVGFTVTGTDKHGDPVYIKGIQGVVERNTMRYFFALESYFYADNKSFQVSLNRWFDYVEKYPKQLYEMPRDEYIDTKLHEFADTRILQLKANAS